MATSAQVKPPSPTRESGASGGADPQSGIRTGMTPPSTPQVRLARDSPGTLPDERSEKPFRRTDPPAVRSGKVKRKPSHRPQRSMSGVVFHTPSDKR